jgi:hypothetical protein
MLSHKNTHCNFPAKVVEAIIIKKVVHLISKVESGMEISLLIPVFNYDIIALVHSMNSAMGKVPELVEILIGDDGSSPEYREKYRSIEGEGVRIISSERNIGRSAIRNKLEWKQEVTISFS